MFYALQDFRSTTFYIFYYQCASGLEAIILLVLSTIISLKGAMHQFPVPAEAGNAFGA